MNEFLLGKRWWATADRWRAFPPGDDFVAREWVESEDGGGWIILDLGDDLGFRAGVIGDKPSRPKINSMAALLLDTVDQNSYFVTLPTDGEDEIYTLEVQDSQVVAERLISLEDISDHIQHAYERNLPVFTADSIDVSVALPAGAEVGQIESADLTQGIGKKYQFKTGGGGWGQTAIQIGGILAGLFVLVYMFKPEWLEFNKVESPVPLVKPQAQKERERMALMKERVAQELKRYTATPDPVSVYQSCDSRRLEQPLSIGGWPWNVLHCGERSFQASFLRKKGTAPMDEVERMAGAFFNDYSWNVTSDRLHAVARINTPVRAGLEIQDLPVRSDALRPLAHYVQTRFDIGHRVSVKDMGLRPLKITYEGTQYDVRPELNFGTLRLNLNRTMVVDVYGLLDLINKPNTRFVKLDWNSDGKTATVTGQFDIFYRSQ